jgi:hypothetical protein
MAQSNNLREQAERCRRLARESIDTALRDSLLELADEYMARAVALQSAETEFESPARTTMAPI